MAAVAITEQVADSTAGPFACLLEQYAEAPPVDTAAVVLVEQHADEGTGSLAGVRIVGQSAIASSGVYRPASMAVASGARQWKPMYPKVSSGSGSWS